MVSLMIYEIKGLAKKDVLKVQGYSKLNEKEENQNIELKQYIENFKEDGNVFSFIFKHETSTKVEIGGKSLPNFHVYCGKIWILFKDKNYMFISAPDMEDFISSMILTIIQSHLENLEKELIMEKVDLKECFLEVINKDASKVTSSWFKKINPQEQSAYLSGTLRDSEGRESQLYKQLKEKAKQQSSISIISKKLVNKITISESKLSSRNQEINAISLIDYFEKIILPIISQQD
ncbi:hypothetical protein [Methanobrevibacter ruminantium]|uniref:hypothetical protein n=1 Tax=Methanobrevibacter ruminantium TaxID=83816 RepID=UPI0026F15D13|nr:hypothetical protein [Methanobrevibacter ruminantium]